MDATTQTNTPSVPKLMADSFAAAQTQAQRGTTTRTPAETEVTAKKREEPSTAPALSTDLSEWDIPLSQMVGQTTSNPSGQLYQVSLHFTYLQHLNLHSRPTDHLLLCREKEGDYSLLLLMMTMLPLLLNTFIKFPVQSVMYPQNPLYNQLHHHLKHRNKLPYNLLHSLRHSNPHSLHHNILPLLLNTLSLLSLALNHHHPTPPIPKRQTKNHRGLNLTFQSTANPLQQMTTQNPLNQKFTTTKVNRNTNVTVRLGKKNFSLSNWYCSPIYRDGHNTGLISTTNGRDRT